MLNVCRHRAMRVVRADVGSSAHFRCPYHGFTYSSTGQLTGVPFQQDAYGNTLDKAQIRLLQARVGIYRGLIFATWNHDGESLDEYLGAMRWYLDLVAGRGEMEILGPAQKWTVPSTWKLPAENFVSDAYHTAYTEAELLDGNRLDEWLALLTDDVVYQMPVRLTRERSAPNDVSHDMYYFDETQATLRTRIARLKTDFAWAEDPPSRTRHCVSNVRVAPGTGADDLDVRSYLLLYRNRGDDPGHDLLSAERTDVLRRLDGVWRLARRCIILDQANLGTRNLAIFL
jgi:phenylpropionate dioxygenase-like ring-hydroxylating dioxygenase large terminal subunit